MWDFAKWIGLPEEEIRSKGIYENQLNGHFAHFRCLVERNGENPLRILITAVSRYKLWVNGIPAGTGPLRGDQFRQYYDEIDLTAFLVPGRNELHVQVLYGNPDAVFDQYEERAPLFSLSSPAACGHLLAVEGDLDEGHSVTTGTAAWEVCLDDSFTVLGGDEAAANLGSIKENIDIRRQKQALIYQTPKIYGPVRADDFHKKVGLLGHFNLVPRDIPPLFEEKGEFSEETRSIFKEGKVLVPAHKKAEILLDPLVHTNAYIEYRFEGGAGAKISMLYSEKFERDPDAEPGTDCSTLPPLARDDKEHGILKGIRDTLVLDGTPLTYEPFWYRTFRFLSLTVETIDEAVTVYLPEFRRTGFPLKASARICSSVRWVPELFDICLRTLQNCMMETYMDCPFYEQMQFPMDTRLQMLFTYAVGGDLSLARKALYDFHSSMIPDGLILGKAPCAFPQVISTFSLYYIFAIKEYYDHTGDLEIVRRYRADVDTILEYYHRHIGESGLVENLDYWQFVDWQKEWKDNMGVPEAALSGPSAIINLMYALALKNGAVLYEKTGRRETAEEYLERSRAVVSRVRELCWDEERGLLREGPAIAQYSQHAQSWAVLNGMFPKEEAAKVMHRTLSAPDVIPSSFSTGYEVFRAFEEAGIYKETFTLMEKWIRLLDLHCTTCPEEPLNGRSECHAWSALPMYEFIRTIAGIRPKESGWKEIEVRPELSYVPDIRGVVATPAGKIYFDFNKAEDSRKVKVERVQQSEIH